jgi:uncharacterized protein YndB with AHSA1/START domain
MVTKSSPNTTMTMPSDREIIIEREFNAPRAIVFEALTRPEHVRRWYGLRSTTLSVCQIDLRVGGKWRYVIRDADGNEFGFSGEYREVVPPERVVSTENFEGIPPGHDYLVTMTLTEHDGKTKMRSHLVYKCVEDRDGHVNSGMEPGMRETLDRLGELIDMLV